MLLRKKEGKNSKKRREENLIAFIKDGKEFRRFERKGRERAGDTACLDDAKEGKA